MAPGWIQILSNTELSRSPISGFASPKAKTRTKYSGKGGYSCTAFKSYGLPTSIVLALVEASNHSLSKNTWKAYNTAERHISRCEKDTKVKLRMPFGVKETLTYIGWLRSVQKVQAVTIEKYMSGIRVAHLKRGHMVPALRPDIVRAVLDGAAQQDEIEMKLKNKPPRLAVTLDIMELIHFELSGMNWDHSKKRMVWMVCCLCFSGSFRIHEILARDQMSFDSTTCLLGVDLTVDKMDDNGDDIGIIKVHLKSPKEQRLKKGITLELFETGTRICPVAAYRKWRKVSKLRMIGGKPAIRLDSGKAYTGRQFNKDLKSLLGKHVNYDEKKVLSHSFRAGLATTMAAMGYSG